MLLGNQQMFVSITDFQEPGVSPHKLGGQRQERGSERGSVSKPFGQKSSALNRAHNAASIEPLLNSSSINPATC